MLVATTVAREQITFTDVPPPQPQPGSAVIAIDNVTLCGTDVHIWADDYASELPLIQGHEIVGRVAALDPQDEGGSWEVGNQVAVNPMIYCGSCHACRAGRENTCAHMRVLGCHTDGAFQEELLVPLEKLHRVPEGVPMEIAALSEPISIATQAVNRSAAASGDKVVVIGCGPIGLFTTLRLNALGADVLSVDRMQSRVEMARRFGASAVQLAPSDRLWPSPEQREAVAAWTDGQGPAVVIEAAGVPGSLEAALDVVANAGRVVCVGISNQVAQLSMRTLPYKEIDLLGSRNSLHLIPDALKLIEQFPELTGSLITHRFPLRELDAALRLTASGTEGIGKIAIDVSQPGQR